jgi:probable lipoprotein NlpC
MNGKCTLKIMLLCALVTSGWLGSSIGSSQKASAATPESLGLVSLGKEFVGIPYRYGAPSGITSAFDCSSFTQYVFDQVGITLPRTAATQSHLGQKVDKGYLSVGDLVYFKASGNGIGHVAIYAGNGMILHSSSSKGVTLSSLKSSYWKKNYVTARRVL